MRERHDYLILKFHDYKNLTSTVGFKVVQADEVKPGDIFLSRPTAEHVVKYLTKFTKQEYS